MRQHPTHGQAMHNLRVATLHQCIALLLYTAALAVYLIKALT